MAIQKRLVQTGVWPKGLKFSQDLDGFRLMVHLGCGTDTPPGWLNVDIRPNLNVGLVADLRDLPIPDNSAAVVEMRYVLEHFSIAEVPTILEEIRRILQPNGMLTVTSPDVEAIPKHFASASFLGTWDDWVRRFYGSQDCQHNFRKSCFAVRYIPSLMESCGFVVEDIRQEWHDQYPVVKWTSRKSVRPGLKMLVWERSSHHDAWALATDHFFQRCGWDTKRLRWFGNREEGKNFEAAKVEEVEHLCRVWKPDVFFAYPAWELGPPKSILEALKRHGVLCIGWSHDEPYRFDGLDHLIERTAPLYDIWFTNWGTNRYLKWWRERDLDIRYLPCSALPYMRKVPEVPKKYDLSFLGTYYAPRRRYLQAVSDLDLHVWLGRRDWPDSGEWPPPPDVEVRRVLTPTRHEDTPNIVAATKINIDICEQPDGRVRCAKTRLFEIANCGGFALSGRCPAVLRHFREGRDIECYDTPHELREKALYYLTHRDERERIAESGWNVASSGHTLFHRVMHISQAAEEAAHARSPVHDRRTNIVGVVIVHDSSLDALERSLKSIGSHTPVVVVGLLEKAEVGLGTFEGVPNIQCIAYAPGGDGEAKDPWSKGVSHCLTPFIVPLRSGDVLLGGWRAVIERELRTGVDVVVGKALAGTLCESANERPMPRVGSLCLSRQACETVSAYLPGADGRGLYAILERLEEEGYSTRRLDAILCQLQTCERRDPYDVTSAAV